MADPYYDPKDLEDFQNITSDDPDTGNAFFAYYAKATGPGKLTEWEKSLIALTVAAVRHCPYCIDAYTNKCLRHLLKTDPEFAPWMTGFPGWQACCN